MILSYFALTGNFEELFPTLKNAKSGDTDHIPGDEGIENGIYHGLHRLPRRSLV